MARDYPALEIHSNTVIDEDYVERLMAAVDDASPTAVEERADGSVRLFFATNDHRDRGAELLRAYVSLGAFADLRVLSIEVPDEDWAARSQAGLGSVQIGRIRVDPGARDDGTDSGVEAITIPPSMGFGTGHHASTRRCLELLQRIPLDGARVLDVGTGSGLLAIAAWRLGAKSVVALDCDPDALEAARENVERNGGNEAVVIVEEDLAKLPQSSDPKVRPPFNVVLANLTGSLLERSAGVLAGLLAPGGRLIASGFQGPEAPAVSAQFEAAGLELTDRADEDGWVGAVFTSPSASRSS